MNILLLEDDYLYAISVQEYLEELGFSVDLFSDGDIACKNISTKFYHLYILDLKVINASGFEVLEYIKSLKITSPIMMMTSLTDIDSIERAYKLGCNEYLKKPFELKELKFRINELIKQFYDCDENKVTIANDYKYDLITKNLYKNNELIDLTNKETALIELLLSNKSKYTSVVDIYEYVWGSSTNYVSNLSDVRVYVKRIRVKTKNDFIISARGLGYKINV